MRNSISVLAAHVRSRPRRSRVLFQCGSSETRYFQQEFGLLKFDVGEMGDQP